MPHEITSKTYLLKHPGGWRPALGTEADLAVFLRLYEAVKECSGSVPSEFKDALDHGAFLSEDGQTLIHTDESRAWEATAYARARAAEYPDMADYLDAQVKKASADAAVRRAGEDQEAAYLAKCQAVKAKYPKPA